MPSETHDKEIEQYRSLLETPDTFEDGFGWTTVAGIFFCGLVMMPGGIYLGLMTGYGLGQAASWVTVILFSEVARRALKTMSKQNLVILLHAAHVMMAGSVLFPGGPLGHLVFRAYLVGSDAVRDAGMYGAFPDWFCPKPNSPAITERIFFHRDWLVPIAIVFFTMIIGLVKRYTLGYFFFRLTSDIENLPFPLAPIRAQGAMALAEADDHVTVEDEKRGLGHAGERKKSLRWRLFSLGASLGIAFGMFQVGIPAITGLFLTKPFYLIPLPFVDTTTLTEALLPATPTGVTIDMGIILLGFVLPFWAVMGTFFAICLTLILNPILHHFGILQLWQPGMNTVNTTFSNSIDFWLSFGIGAGVGIAVICLFATLRDVRQKLKEFKAKRKEGEKRENLWATPQKGRGDYPLWIAVVAYVFIAAVLVVLCYYLLITKSQLTNVGGILFFLIFFAFFYNPFISYVNARLLGISGQHVDIPYIREAVYLLSGAKGVDIWLAPVPLDNFGEQAQSFRVNELTGVSFWSLVKTDLVAFPVLFFLSLMFWSFIWKSDAVPSEVFPAAQINWELAAKNQVLLFSSTFVGPGDTEAKSIKDTEFWKAIHGTVIGAGFGVTVILYSVLSFFGLPVMLVYGMIRGLGQLPHVMILEVVGALTARFYFQKKFGQKEFLRAAPTLLAGYMTGVGLIGMATIAMKLIKSAISAAPL
jgi:hypothetical protein